MENESNTISKTITLRSSDGADFIVSKAAAMQSQLIRRTIKDNPTQELIPLTEVNAQILSKVIGYCTHQAEVTPTSSGKAQEELSDWAEVTPTSSGKAQEELSDLAEVTLRSSGKAQGEQSDWDREFLFDVSVSEDILEELFEAARYLEIEGLMDLIEQKIEGIIDQGESIWEICHTFGFHAWSKPFIDEEAIARYEERIGATLSVSISVSVSGSDKISASNDSEDEIGKRNITKEREASRLALDQVQKTVEIDNSGLSWDLKRLDFPFLSQTDEFRATDDSDS